MALELAQTYKEMMKSGEFRRLEHSSPWPHFVVDGLLPITSFTKVQSQILASSPNYTIAEDHPAKIQLDHLPDLALTEFFFGDEMRGFLEGLSGKALRPNEEIAIQIRRMTDDSPEFPPHIDLIEKPSLIALYYVAPGWQDGGGGELVLLKNEDGGEEKAVAPLENRLVLFWTGDQYWHMVRRVKNWTRLMVLTEWLIEE